MRKLLHRNSPSLDSSDVKDSISKENRRAVSGQLQVAVLISMPSPHRPGLRPSDADAESAKISEKSSPISQEDVHGSNDDDDFNYSLGLASVPCTFLVEDG